MFIFIEWIVKTMKMKTMLKPVQNIWKTIEWNNLIKKIIKPDIQDKNLKNINSDLIIK
jgi:hypothetical protein